MRVRGGLIFIKSPGVAWKLELYLEKAVFLKKKPTFILPVIFQESPFELAAGSPAILSEGINEHL